MNTERSQSQHSNDEITSSQEEKLLNVVSSPSKLLENENAKLNMERKMDFSTGEFIDTGNGHKNPEQFNFNFNPKIVNANESNVADITLTPRMGRESVSSSASMVRGMEPKPKPSNVKFDPTKPLSFASTPVKPDSAKGKWSEKAKPKILASPKLTFGKEKSDTNQTASAGFSGHSSTDDANNFGNIPPAQTSTPTPASVKPNGHKKKKISGCEQRKRRMAKLLLNAEQSDTPTGGQKRTRETTGSGGLNVRPSKKPDNKNTPTYAETLSKANLLIAVIDLGENNTLKIIEDEQYFKFLAAMQKLYMAHLKTQKLGNFVPLFTENRNIRSAIRIRCSDSSARKWMESSIPSIKSKDLWDGANLQVIDFHHLPKPQTVQIWCPGFAGSTPDIMQLLQTCNPGLNVSNWSIIRRLTSEKGASIKVGLDSKSKTFIEARRNKLFFGIAQAIFYFPKKKSKLNQPKEKNPLPMTETETEAETETGTDDETGKHLQSTSAGASTADVTVIHHPASTEDKTEENGPMDQL